MTTPTPPEATGLAITTSTEPVVIGPRTRVFRTVFQVVLGVLAAIPTAAAIFGLSVATTTKISATSAALIILVSAAHNAFNAKQAES